MFRRVFAIVTTGLVAGLLTPAAPVDAAVDRTDVAAAAAAVVGVPWTTGADGFGQLGNGAAGARRTYASMGLTNVVDIHGGREHVAVVRGDGSVWTWGSNKQGQLGVGGSTNRPSPVQVPGHRRCRGRRDRPQLHDGAAG